MKISDEFDEVLNAIAAGQKRYPGGDILDEGRLKEELDQIFDQCGGTAKEGTFAWYFHTASKRSFLRYKLRNQGVDRRRPLPLGELEVPLTHSRLIRRLWRINKAKRPLSSQFCSGMPQAYLNQALRVYESGWLTEKGVNSLNPIGTLRSRRLKPADHDRIRFLISDRVIPALSFQRREENATKLWKQTLVLELADLFARYAPPPKYDDLGIAALPAGQETLFIKFVHCALGYFDPNIAPSCEVLSKFWLDRKRTMLGAYYREQNP